MNFHTRVGGQDSMSKHSLTDGVDHRLLANFQGARFAVAVDAWAKKPGSFLKMCFFMFCQFSTILRTSCYQALRELRETNLNATRWKCAASTQKARRSQLQEAKLHVKSDLTAGGEDRLLHECYYKVVKQNMRGHSRPHGFFVGP